MECYENIKFLGCGSFGKAFLCRKVENRKLYVAKELVVDKEITSDYENESKILMNLDHPNIVQWFDTFTINSKAVIIMEYMSGGMLSDYLKKQVGLLNEKEVIYKFVQLILALDFLHCKRIIHRDITSHNVLLSHSNNVVKLSDFGMASIINKSRKVEGIAGTPSYIAPEVLETNRSDEKSDIWSLGCVLFEMLTLKKSFKNIIAPNVLLETSYKVVLNQHQISKNFSKNLRNLVQNMLSINPDDRPNTSSLIALPFLMKFCVEVPMFLGAFYDKPLNQLEFASSGIESELSLCQNQEGSEIFVIDKSQLEEHIAIPWSNGAKIFDKLIQITANETHLYGLTEFGSLVSWEVSKKSKSSIKWKFIGSSDVNCLVKVSCGDSYVAAISDSGIIFTMGYGKFGCLGHGDFEDKLKLLPAFKQSCELF